VPEPVFTDEELDAAVQLLSEPGRLDAAQDLVLRAAPSLQRVLASALAEGGWFDSGHSQAVSDAIAEGDPESQVRAVRTLLAEETRLGMLVGVAVGFELSRTLNATEPPQED
jgi:hypothetical protein